MEKCAKSDAIRHFCGTVKHIIFFFFSINSARNDSKFFGSKINSSFCFAHNYELCNALFKKIYALVYAPNQSKPELDESKYAHCVAYVNQLLHHEVNSAIPRLTTIDRWFLTNMFMLPSWF